MASEDLPAPLGPVMATSSPGDSARSTLRRLCVLAPRKRIGSIGRSLLPRCATSASVPRLERTSRPSTRARAGPNSSARAGHKDEAYAADASALDLQKLYAKGGARA